MTVSVLWLFLAVPYIGLQYVIVVIPDHTNFLVCLLLRFSSRDANVCFIFSGMSFKGLSSQRGKIGPVKSYFRNV